MDLPPHQEIDAPQGRRRDAADFGRLSRNVAVGVAGVSMVAALALGVAARRKRISVAALLVNAAARYVAPDLDGQGALARAIAQDRARGPALPPRSLRQTMRFADESVDGARQFRLTQTADRSAFSILYLHGGAYVFEVQSVQWTLVDRLLKIVSADVVMPIYPLAPEHRCTDSLFAVEKTYRTLVAQAGAANVVILGDSAGGGLALLLAQRLRDAGADLPAALVLVSPWLDIGGSGEDQPAREKRDPALTLAFLRAAGRLWAGDVPADDPRVSPLFGDLSGLPPTIVFSGGRDILASDAFRLAARSPNVVHRHYEEMIHVWTAAPIPEGRRALREAAAFIMQHLPSARRPMDGRKAGAIRLDNK